MWMFFFVIIPIALWQLGFARTLLFYVLSIVSGLYLLLGFALGTIISFMGGTSMKHWKIPDFMVKDIIDSPDFTLLNGLVLPFVFVLDLFRMCFSLLINYGTAPMWVTTLLAAGSLAWFWGVVLSGILNSTYKPVEKEVPKAKPVSGALYYNENGVPCRYD